MILVHGPIRNTLMVVLTIVVDLLMIIGNSVSDDHFAVQPHRELARWLENMIWHHQYSIEEVQQATGLSKEEVQSALNQFNISAANRPAAPVDPVIQILPYPGGRHPRIGFLEGAVAPMRGTKISVFAPWDPSSYVVLDVPEAIWSNLGLTFLAHTHIDTIWTKQGQIINDQDWTCGESGALCSHWSLPNGIEFQMTATPHRGYLQLRMDLTNGTSERLTDLRVQMCALLKGAKGFDIQTNDNKVFRENLVACRDERGTRWVIFGWQPIHRTWGNPPCPCLHADPKIPDCAPGETQSVYGWFSFYEGTELDSELNRIAAMWKPMEEKTIQGEVRDIENGELIPCRMYVQGEDGRWHFAATASSDGRAVAYEKQNWLNPESVEFHTSLSPHPFQLRLSPGRYTIRVERGKEYFPVESSFTVEPGDNPPKLSILLRRWINMNQLGWFCADTHVHRPIRQLPVAMLADDVNIAFPMVYWTTRSDRTAAAGDRTNRDDAELPPNIVSIDDHHLIWPKNTEWEIFSIGSQRHTLGAVLALNHKSPFDLAIPPVRSILDQAEREGAILEIEKHDWPFSVMLPSLLGGSMSFELANNHMWRTAFAFSNWSTPPAPWMNVGDGTSGSEKNWMEFTHRTYWCLLNCGYRLIPSAGTATGVHPVPIGYGRVYVRVPAETHGDLDFQRWIDEWKAGQCFVTTGPMLFTDIDPHGTYARCEIVADSKLASVEWIVDGAIAEIATPEPEWKADGSVTVNCQMQHVPNTAHWIAVRAWQQSAEGKWRFAHSAPMWIENRPPMVPSKQELEFLLDRVRIEIERSRSILGPEALAEYASVLRAWESRLDSLDK